MRLDMHGAVLNQLMHPGNFYSEETIQLALLLVSGIRDDVWVNNTRIDWTPERGIRIASNDRDIDSPRGYYDIYVHDYYWEVFIQPARGRSRYTINLSATRNEDSWDIPFQWMDMNSALIRVDGQRI